MRTFPVDFGNSSYCRQIGEDQIRPAWESLEKILKHVEYRGIFSAEFKLDPRDGKYKIIEINSRAWVFVDFAGWCGVNVCWLAYLDALGKTVPMLRSRRRRAACVDTYNDYQLIKSSLSSDRPGILRTLAQWVGARRPLLCWDDPKPALCFLIDIVKARFGRV